MATGIVEFSTFVWTVPGIRSQFPTYCFHEVFSPECHLPDSSWKLKASGSLARVSINLMRTDSGPSKVFTCKVKSNIYSRVDTLTGEFRSYTLFPNLEISKYELQLKSNLVIMCYINSNTPQQKAAECISRKFTTCAVRTEGANSVIGRENPKDEDWSSLDIKDDTLLRERMKEMLIKGSEHDVTICVRDKEFQAHRDILSSRSPVFAMMLTHDSKEKNTGKIKIEDCDPESFKEFLLYVYSGRTENLTPTNALQLYYPADKYDFPVLKERCVRILKTSLSVESICDVVLLAAKHHEKELLEMATEFFAKNRKKIFVSVNWQKFLSENLVVANEMLIKSEDIRNPEN